MPKANKLYSTKILREVAYCFHNLKGYSLSGYMVSIPPSSSCTIYNAICIYYIYSIYFVVIYVSLLITNLCDFTYYSLYLSN